MDAVFDGSGNVVCRNVEAQAAGCVPLNPFGYGRSSEEAINYVNTSLATQNTQQLYNAGVSINGELFELPAGPLSSAFGVEWRRETSNSLPEASAMDGSTAFSTSAIVKGAFEVKEFFAEFLLPVFADKSFARELNIEAAVRVSDYTSIGSTSTWKVGGEWIPSEEDLRFRTTFSQGQ